MATERYLVVTVQEGKGPRNCDHLKVEIDCCVFFFVILNFFHNCHPRCSSKPKKKNNCRVFWAKEFGYITSSVTPTVPRIM